MMPRFLLRRVLFLLVVIVLIASWPGGAAGAAQPAAGPAAAATPSAYTIVNRNSGKCLQVTGTADGAAVRQWTWLNNNCQQWRLQPA